MSDSEKKMILIVVVIGVVITGGLLIWKNTRKKDVVVNNGGTNIVLDDEKNKLKEYAQELADGSKLNISEELQKTKMLDGLEIKNMQLKEKNGISILLADVENKSGAQTNVKNVKVDILDKEGKIIGTMRGPIDPIPAGGKVQLNMSAGGDFSNAYDFKISNQ